MELFQYMRETFNNIGVLTEKAFYEMIISNSKFPNFLAYYLSCGNKIYSEFIFQNLTEFFKYNENQSEIQIFKGDFSKLTKKEQELLSFYLIFAFILALACFGFLGIVSDILEINIKIFFGILESLFCKNVFINRMEKFMQIVLNTFSLIAKFCIVYFMFFFKITTEE